MTKKTKQMKHFIVVGDNNFWYAYLHASTKHELNKAIKEVEEGIKNRDYNAEISPSNLQVYQLSFPAPILEINIDFHK